MFYKKRYRKHFFFNKSWVQFYQSKILRIAILKKISLAVNVCLSTVFNVFHVICCLNAYHSLEKVLARFRNYPKGRCPKCWRVHPMSSLSVVLWSPQLSPIVTWGQILEDSKILRTSASLVHFYAAIAPPY